MGKPSREKGKRGEREVAKILREYGYDTHRGVQYHGGPDSPDVIGLPGIHVEVKRVEKLNLKDAYRQSCDDADKDIPVVMHRKNNEKWMVSMGLDDWMILYDLAQKSVKQIDSRPERSMQDVWESMHSQL